MSRVERTGTQWPPARAPVGRAGADHRPQPARSAKRQTKLIAATVAFAATPEMKVISCTPITTRSIVVLPVRIELTTSPLPRGCSTTELRQRPAGSENRKTCVGRKAGRSLPQGRRGRKHARSVRYRGLCLRCLAVVVSAHERTARGCRSRASQARGKGRAAAAPWRGAAGESQAAQGASQGPRRGRRRRGRRKTSRFRRNWRR
jgi:hypothetical protein